MVLLCGLGGNRADPEVARTPLVAAAKTLIEVLDEIDQYPALYLNHRMLRNAIFRYEHRWIPLLARAPSKERITLVPPLDVEWVWICHMLCPVEYIADSAAMWNAACPDEHPIVIDHKLIRGSKRYKGKERASSLWKEMFPEEPFNVLQSIKDAPFRESITDRERAGQYYYDEFRQSRITYDILAASERHMAFHYQVGMPQYRDHRFMRLAEERYAMFLTLHSRFPGEFWVPTYDIDIMWHAHMMHPRWYTESTEKFRGSVLPHDVTANDRSTGLQVDMRWNATVKQWKEMFRVPIVLEGGMWRGNVEADERIQRPYILKLTECVTKKVQTILEKHAGPHPRPGLYNEVEFTVWYGGDVNWTDTKVGWVHMADWRRANRDGREPVSGTENKVERLAFLKHSNQLILLTCRTLHFLMYPRYGNPYDFRTILEVFGTSPNIPIATAHHVPHQSMCEQYSKSWTPCKRLPGENILLLRVDGEDFALLGGNWAGFVPPKKGASCSRGKSGNEGSLQLRLWLLKKNQTTPFAAGRWQNKRGSGTSEAPRRYSFMLPVLDDGRVIGEEKVKFDLETSVVKVRHAAHIVPAYLISMASAALHVTLQPRFLPEGGVSSKCAKKMYPEWKMGKHQYSMLRGAGEESFAETGNHGLCIMLCRNLQSRWPWSKLSSGTAPKTQAPADTVPEECDGCGGKCATCG